MSYQRQQRYRRRMSDMNVVPYIDVMLVLLIIFMITSPLLSQSVEVELPTVKKAKQVISDQKIKFVIITVDAQGKLFLDNSKQSLTPGNLLTRVAELIRFDPNSQVLVRGDNLLAYGEVVKIMSLLQDAGVKRVGLLTKSLEERS